MSLSEDDDLSWYARKAARAAVAPGRAPDPARVARIRARLEALTAAGVKGDPASMTLYTRRLPPGCVPCLDGAGSNLLVTGLCTRDCFFCFNHKPRKDELVVHGIPVERPEEAPAIVRRFGLRSVGLSGGEPLTRTSRVLRLLNALKGMDDPPRVDLYTNGDLATDAVLRVLKINGLDGIRFDAVARDFDLDPVARARRLFEETAVEVPVVPAQLERLKTMCRALERLGVSYLNIHELFVSPENESRMAEAGERPTDGGGAHLTWRPTPDSLEACLELLDFALRECPGLSVYLCSCGTQEAISRRGLARRRAGDCAIIEG